MKREITSISSKSITNYNRIRSPSTNLNSNNTVCDAVVLDSDIYIHFAQCEYFGDDPEEEESNEDMEEWEMARDVFSEAPFEL